MARCIDSRRNSGDTFRESKLSSPRFTYLRLQQGIQAANDGQNDYRSRWKRTVHFATRLQQIEDSSNNDNTQVPNIEAKALETQHWLELTDGLAFEAFLIYQSLIWTSESIGTGQI